MKKITVADVAACLPPRKLAEDPWPVSLFFRPISLRLCPVFYRLGFSPSGVTVLGIVVTLLLPLSLLSMNVMTAVVLFAAGMIVIEILDCIDGDLARVTGRSSAPGACLDAVADVFFRALAVATLGGLTALHLPQSLDGQGRHGLVLGLCAACFILLAKLIRNRVEMASEKVAVWDAPTDESASSPGSGLLHFLSGLYAAIPLLLPVAGILEVVPVFFVAWAFYALCDLILTVYQATRHFAS